MNKKKILILMLVSLFLINIFAVVVRADPPVNGGAGIIDVIKDSATLKYLAVDFVEGIKQTPPAKEAVIVAKFLAVVLITLVLYQLISLVPTLKEWNKNSRIGLAVLIALIAGIATPTEYLKKIIVGAGYFVVLIPLVIILVLCSYGLFKWTEGKDRTDYIWRSIITVIIVYVLTTISTLLTGMELQEWGMTGFITSILAIVEVIAILYFVYCVYGVVTGAPKGETVAARVVEKLPTKISRPLRKIGRDMYRADRLTDREIDDMEEIVNKLKPMELYGHEAKPDEIRDTRKVLGDVGNIINRQKQIVERTRNLTVDLFTWAKQIKSRKLIDEAEGIEILIDQLEENIKKGTEQFDECTTIVYDAYNKGGYPSPAVWEKAKKARNDAVGEYERALDILKKIQVLERKIEKEAGTKDIGIESPPIGM